MLIILIKFNDDDEKKLSFEFAIDYRYFFFNHSFSISNSFSIISGQQRIFERQNDDNNNSNLMFKTKIIWYGFIQNQSIFGYKLRKKLSIKSMKMMMKRVTKKQEILLDLWMSKKKK